MGWNGKRWLIGLWLIMLGIMTRGLSVRAAGFYENSNIRFSPDGGAWTIQGPLPDSRDAFLTENPSCWYPKGERYDLGTASSLEKLKVGQHYYSYNREGVIPVSRWEVVHREAACIHRKALPFHGYLETRGPCQARYYSGWNAYCADCGEVISRKYIYMSREQMRSLTQIDLSLDYYYFCPTCGHMEQGCELVHACKAISANRYRVVYQANAGDAVGNMYPSFHMYDHANRYEGEAVTPCKFLTKCSFQRQGYRFLGWNTRPDGTGDFYEDEAESLNLTDENYDPEQGKGSVKLYAQWERITGTLLIDPGEGKYVGKAGIQTYETGYGKDFFLGSEKLTMPRGYQVSFDTGAGDPLEPVIGSVHFLLWNLRTPAAGSLRGENYTFWGENGEEDLVTAIYESEEILLPLPVRQGYSFGGWYGDAALQEQVGDAGDPYQPTCDTTLYACWVELVLQTEVNLSANGGKGAVDLSWRQEDGRNKSYLAFQRQMGGEFQMVYGSGGEKEPPREAYFSFQGKEETHEIPYTGVYEITAYGAQGQGYENDPGGKGGMAKASFYLEAGDVLTVSIGGTDGYGQGGSALEYGGGGGRTMITSEKLGVLIIAGGGGGASPAGAGGDGGLEAGLREDGAGAGGDGKSAGGGGAIGGRAGEYTIHVHEESCKHVHLGDEESGGACYRQTQIPQNCVTVVSGPYRGETDTVDCDVCISQGRNGYGTLRLYSWTISHTGCGKVDYGSNGWWRCDVCGFLGYTWGSGTRRPSGADHIYQKLVYVLDCEREYDCTMPPGIMLPSYGGSTYVNHAARTAERNAGVQKGDGCVKITPLRVGYRNTTQAKGVEAPDLEPPCSIEGQRVQVETTPEGRILVSFDRPRDVGTWYQHQVKSYPAGSDTELSLSNITSTEVVTGIRGYLCRMDEQENVTLNRENAERLLSLEEVIVQPGKNKQYLHLAPMDRAGNVGETLTLVLDGEDERLAWIPETEQLIPSGLVGERDYGSVAPGEDNIYYVRADGRTPFSLSFAAGLTGPAREKYQIQAMGFVATMEEGKLSGEYRMLVPCAPAGEGDMAYPGEELGRQTLGKEILSIFLFGSACRCQENARLEVCQAFTLDRDYHGKKIRVIPRAGAGEEEKRTWSCEEQDERNGVTLVGDGQAPVIDGLEQAGQLLQGDRQGALVMDFSARDSLSGVAFFQVTLQNLDNDWEAVYTADEAGKLQVRIEEDSPLFDGDVRLVAKAVDRVGNCKIQEIDANEFSLEAVVYRMLEPHDTVFKRGETGILKIRTRGYATKVEVEFPREFTEKEPGLNKVYHYTVPLPVAEETLEFMIPLYLLYDREYTICVRAYKGERMLEEHPGLCTVRVDGSVLEELRTRLR